MFLSLLSGHTYSCQDRKEDEDMAFSVPDCVCSEH